MVFVGRFVLAERADFSLLREAAGECGGEYDGDTGEVERGLELVDFVRPLGSEGFVGIRTTPEGVGMSRSDFFALGVVDSFSFVDMALMKGEKKK